MLCLTFLRLGHLLVGRCRVRDILFIRGLDYDVDQSMVLSIDKTGRSLIQVQHVVSKVEE